MRFTVSEGLEALESFAAVRETWDLLARGRGSPFLTSAWIEPWLEHRAAGTPLLATLHGDDGTLRAGALFLRTRFGVCAAADEHTGDWDVVAASQTDRARLWEELARTGPRLILLTALRADAPEAAVARDRLRRAGYGLVRDAVDLRSPYIVLPRDDDALIQGLGRHARAEWRRRRRALAREGEVVFRVTTGGGDLERDLDTFLRLEHAGWKGRNGTAILDDPSAERLYRGFARRAADAGMLRLALLESDGETVAAALGFALGTEGAVLKSAYDERRRTFAPGFLLRIEMLRAAIGEGLHGYDLLGAADPHKVRLATVLRPRQRLRAYRVPAARMAEHAWEAGPRPALVAARDYVAARPELRSRLVRGQRSIGRLHRRAAAAR